MTDKKTITLTKGLIKLPDGTYIAPYTDTKGALEIGDIGQSLFVNETEGLRRKLNGQTVSINENTKDFLDKLKTIRQWYPSLFCTEERWQEIAKSNYLGQVGKFVIDEEPKEYNYHFNVLRLGNINITGDGIAYNFVNNTNSLYLPTTLPFESAENIEIVFKINVTDYTYCVLIGNDTDNYNSGGIVVRTDNGQRLYLWATGNKTAWTSSQIDTGIDLTLGEQYIKIVYKDKNSFQISKSLDNKTWVDGTLLTVTSFVNTQNTWLFSTGSTSPLYLKGEVDLKESFINVDMQEWWVGAIVTSISDLPPYIRLPKVISSHGSLTYENLGELDHVYNRKLIACKKPTYEDTTWYNLYSDGWLEQGGRVLQNGATNANWTAYQIFLPIPYKDNLYSICPVTGNTSYTDAPSVWNISPNYFYMQPYNSSGGAHWSTWGWSNAVDSYKQADKIGEPQYSYFIQIAQGEVIQKSIRNDWEIINPYSLFEYKCSSQPVNNASWLPSNGQINSKIVYPTAYEALCVELDDTIQLNETVLLPSGGRYTKHLQQLVYDPNKIEKEGNPVILPNGILTVADKNNYVKFNVDDSIAKADNFSLKFSFIYKDNKNVLATSTNLTPNGFAIRCIDGYIHTLLSFDNTEWNIEKDTKTQYTDGELVTIKLSFNNIDGYKFETYKENKYVEEWNITNIERLTPESNYLLFGTFYDGECVDIDLKTIQFRIQSKDVNTLYSCVKREELVWEKDEHLLSENDYGYKFIVDKIHETFKLPTRIKRERRLVERGEVGNKWYELYSDGFLRQGCHNYTQGSVGLNQLVTLIKSFKDTNYTILAQIKGDLDDSTVCTINCNPYSNNQFQYTQCINNVYFDNAIMWIAEGYSDIPAPELAKDEKIYYYIGDVAQNTSLVDVGRLTEALANKIDKKHVDIYNEERYVVGAYSNGWNWWRKWSDGWVEQGGYISASTGTAQINNLLIPMKNTTYNINITPVVSTWSGGLSSVFGLTTTSFQLWTSDDSSFNSCPVIWEVKGYMA